MFWFTNEKIYLRCTGFPIFPLYFNLEITIRWFFINKKFKISLPMLLSNEYEEVTKFLLTPYIYCIIHMQIFSFTEDGVSQNITKPVGVTNIA